MTDQTIPAHYLKSASHRTVAVTGAILSPTPHGKLTVTPYVDRAPIPTMVPQKLEPGRLVDDHEHMVARQGIIREFEVTMFMDLEVAESVANAILRVVKEMRTALQGVEKASP